MTYLESIRAVERAEAAYYATNTDDALCTFHAAKAAHRAAFGSLARINGRWA